MRFPVIAVVIFATALTSGLMWRKASPGAAPADRNGETLPSKAARRDKTGDSLLSSVRAALRAGDMDRARQLLAEAAEKDPKAFFLVISHLPHLDGWDDLIARAGAAMPWNDPEALRLLHGIPSYSWRQVAWQAYVTARVGQLPDEEVYRVAIRGPGGLTPLLKDGAEKRPAEMMALLNRMGGTSVQEEFCAELMKHHPELAGELFRSIPDGNYGANYDRGYFLQAQVLALPTSRNIMAAVSEAGPGSLTTAWLLVNGSYPSASPAERQQLRQEMARQPGDLRQSMLTGALGNDDKPVPLDEFTELLGMSRSALQQRKALEKWIGQQASLNPADRAWIDQLPTEKLRTRANEILDQKASAGP